MSALGVTLLGDQVRFPRGKQHLTGECVCEAWLLCASEPILVFADGSVKRVYLQGNYCYRGSIGLTVIQGFIVRKQIRRVVPPSNLDSARIELLAIITAIKEVRFRDILIVNDNHSIVLGVREIIRGNTSICSVSKDADLWQELAGLLKLNPSVRVDFAKDYRESRYLQYGKGYAHRTANKLDDEI